MNTWQWKNQEGLLISPQDDRKYRIFKLSNGLRALIIHDKKAKKAAASMAVGVGASSDPEKLPGLAHFCEHMLFLGTEKYPVENTYKAFLNEKGGRSNASTSMDKTVYQFDVGSEHLRGALDIFSQFFLSPLFTESATDREMNAVDSEDAKNRTSDDRRFWQVMKAVADPFHPYSKFSTGNVGTLTCEGLNTRDELLKLHQKHYFAENMGVVVLGTEPLDELQTWVEECFSEVASKDNNDSSAEEWACESMKICDFSSPFPSDTLPKLVQIPPLRENRQLYLQWPMPSTLPHYRSPPTSLFSHLLGHEGKGSIFAALQDQGWALALSSGVRINQPDFNLLQVRVTLTEDGEKHWREVAGTVFEYLSVLRNMSEPEARDLWAETQAVSALGFRFLQESPAYNYVSYLARRLLTYPKDHVLAAHYLRDDLDYNEVQHFREYLTPENCVVYHVSKNFEGKTSCTEKWYSVPFNSLQVSSDEISAWQDIATEIKVKLHLPSANPYIPDDFDLISGEQEEGFVAPNPPTPPSLVLSEQSPLGAHLWHKVDSVFSQPRAALKILCATPLILQEPAGVSILTRAFLQAMAQDFYHAEVAGLGWSLGSQDYGLQLSVAGYSQHAPQLAVDVLSAFVAWEPDERTFNMAKEEQIKSYKNWRMNRPDTHASYFQKLLLEDGKQSVPSKLQYAESMTLEELCKLKKRLLSKIFVQGLIHGNVEESAAKQGFTKLLDCLVKAGVQPLPEHEFPQKRIGGLPDKPCIMSCNVPNEEEKNSALLSYYEFGPASLKDHVKMVLLAQILKEPIFSQLRTKEQLGYIVFSGVQCLGVGKLGNADYFEGFYIKVLSKTRSPQEISSRVKEFLTSQRTLLEEMSQESFQTHIDSLVMKMREPPKKLSSETSLHWREINENTYLWDRYEIAAQILEAQINLEDIVSLFDEVFSSLPAKKRLEVMVAGNSHLQSQPISVEGWDCFQEEEIFQNRRRLFLQPAGSTPFSIINGS